MGGCWSAGDDHVRKRLRGAVSEREISRESYRDPRRNRPRSETSRAGADRERSYEARRGHGIHPKNPEGQRGAGVGR